MKKNRGVFFDRDGIVNKRIFNDYVRSKSQFEFVPHFFLLFSHVKQRGFTAILATNQQGVGKGLMTVEELNNIHIYMQKKIYEKTGFQFDGIEFCPDLAEQNSRRRKPSPGMLLDAAESHSINLLQSFFIGDSETDVLAGKQAGTTTILLKEFGEKVDTQADYVIDSLTEALAIIV